MERRAFLLGLIGGLAAAAGIVGGARPADAMPAAPSDVPGGKGPETAAVRAEDLDGVAVEHTQHYRRRARRYYRRHYHRPVRRHYSRMRRRYRRHY
jgi:hypothetical protein